MKTFLLSCLLSYIVLFFSCSNRNTGNATENRKQQYDHCTNWKCIENSRNKNAVVEGLLRKYTPNESGKGAGVMFWDWEVLLSDSIAIPAVAKNKDLDISELENKKVVVEATVFYGTIVGSDDPPYAQSATGYRLDIESIREK